MRICEKHINTQVYTHTYQINDLMHFVVHQHFMKYLHIWRIYENRPFDNEKEPTQNFWFGIDHFGRRNEKIALKLVF